MPITKQDNWQEWVDNNPDPYGKACVDVARRVMELLDEVEEFKANDLVLRADEETKSGGITGFMAGCVAQMVSHCHSRGEEFRQAWNFEMQLGDEGNEANESTRVLNPALMRIE